ncbi:hypothetical protein OAK47_00510 [Planctomycetaceae bacterium]|nr:hypothetical protein [Planctomycetaceae bacterium]MDG2389898.1 hypothetical protein [Planctomycetaceae bacterium]
MKNISLVTVMTVCLTASIANAGGVKGVFKIKGATPAPVLQVKKGDDDVKDAEVCASQNMFKNDLVINQDTGGIANVFLYMRKAPSDAKFEAPEKKTLVFDQKNCRFVPHAQIVRTDQIVEVISSDGVAHNFHSYPIRNAPQNILVAPNTAAGDGTKVEFDGPEILPMKVGCDIHPWMTAWWMVVDHPYAAVTNEKGEFEIGELPDGTHEFRVWHEKAGYLEKKLEITVKGGKVTDLGTMEYEPSVFEE